MTSRDRDPMVGATVLGRYRIIARLAAGGMGVVYLARAEGAAGFAKPVVVKRVLPDLMGNDQMARLFVREAKILANLQHPNIVGVTDFGEEGSAYIMVLDYVRAYHLGLWQWYRQNKREPLPVEGVIHIIIKVLDALEYAHTLTLPDGTPLDIVHADISPANVLVDTDGQVKLLDFGIARMRGEVTKSTDSNSIRGKFSYLPIEALDGSPPRVSTDVYACGVTLYELLAGENPFTADDETVTLARVISQVPPPLSTLRADVPPELDAIVARAMDKDRSKRFESAKDFARELRRVQRVPEDEAARALAALAKQDYAQMPATAGVSLAELEEAWRNPPPADAGKTRIDVVVATTVRKEGEPEVALEFAPTVPPARAPTPTPAAAAPGTAPVVASGTAPSQADVRPRGTGRLFALIAGVVVVLGGAIAGLAVYLGRRPESEEPKFVLVERGSQSPPVTASGAAPLPEPKEGSSAGAASTGPVAPASPRDAGARAPKAAPPGDPLSAAFAKKQPEIEACFRDQPAAALGSPDISVRFSIDKEGVVQRAELTPAELAPVPLGQCILGVARRTQFPAQPAPATFRIPLRARKAP